MTFTDGSSIVYSYAADGAKLRTVHNINGATTQKDYCGSVIYENGAAKFWQTEAGYISMNDGKYHYYLQDHQGNNRVVVSETGATEEVNHYYAFGGLFSSDESIQPFKYNGKELDTKKGLNWHDYGARQYDAVLGRWFAVDPLAEDYYSWSPYNYCTCNPINFIDPNGNGVETVWDFLNVLLGVKSFGENIDAGNYGAAVLDGVGVLLDAAATILPLVPGGVSISIKAARAADDVVDVAGVTYKIDKVKDATKIGNNGEVARFVGDVDGKIIDTQTTTQGTYIHPNGAETDVLGREHFNKIGGGKVESVGTSHTHNQGKNVAPNGKVYIFREDKAHVPTFEEIMNIINGNTIKK